MRWTINLEGGPKRVNHAACAIGDKIYSFGGYCSGEIRSRLAPIDVYCLDSNTYRWTRMFGESPAKKIKTGTRTGSFTDDSFISGLESDNEVEFEVEDEMMVDDEADQQLVWQYNPLAAPDNGMEVSTNEEETFKNIPYMRYGHTIVAYNNKAYLWGGRSDEFGASSRLFEYNPLTNSWACVPVEGFIPPARDGHSAVVWNEKMLIFGGFEEDNQRFSQEVFMFDFLTNKWSEVKAEGTAPSHRDFHAACILKDQMFIFGGRSDERGQYHSSVDFYDNAIHILDMKELKWIKQSAATNAPPGRRSNTLWSYQGLVYMFGGYESKNNRHFSDLHCYNPEYNAWSQLKPAGQSTPVARRRQCTVLVGSRLFLFGGTRPHENPAKRNALVDLGDLHVLDYENSLFSICVDKIVRSGLYSQYDYLIPECIKEEIHNMITPNNVSRVSRTSNSTSG